MKSADSEFRLVDRGARHTLLLIPGWATDWRIFNPLELNFNYLMPIRFSAFNFESGLLYSLRDNGLGRISILGWSMGGFLASDFALKHQDKIDELIFVSVKERYAKDDIENIKSSIEKNSKAFLYKFYNECFSQDEREALTWFKQNLIKEYISQMGLDVLREGLDYLLAARLRPEKLKGVKMRFIHGQEDRIAPIQEALEIKKVAPEAQFIFIERAGHIPFLNPNFSTRVHEIFGR